MSRLSLIGRVLAVALAVGAIAARSEAATISVVPGAQNATVGLPVSVNIVVSDLAANESVGGASLTLSFNTPDSVLGVPSYVIDPDDKMKFSLDPVNNDLGSGVLGDVLTLAFLADISVDDHTSLKGLQGDGFTLATVTFIPTANGLSLLTLGQINRSAFLSTATGEVPPTVSVDTVNNGQICVGGDCQQTAPVPEPATLSLVGLGVSALIARRRRKARRQA